MVCVVHVSLSGVKHDPEVDTLRLVDLLPPHTAGLFSEGGEEIQLRVEGSLTIPKTGIKRL